MSKLYIALNETSESTIFHWAIIVAHTDDLTKPVEAYHIRMAGGPWESGNGTIELRSVSNFVCCVALPALIAPIATVEAILASQPVEQGSTPLISYYRHWSCEQWVLRAISDLVAQKCLPDAFYTRHQKWKEILYVDVNKCAREALADKNAGGDLDVRVFSL